MPGCNGPFRAPYLDGLPDDIIPGIPTPCPNEVCRLRQVIIDTDPGIDDMAAIFFALASPELHVQSITTVYGNGPVEMSTSNALQILHAAGRLDIPVYPGAGKPLVREPNPGWALQVHGPDAMGGTSAPLPAGHTPNLKSRHAALGIIDRAMAAPG